MPEQQEPDELTNAAQLETRVTERPDFRDFLFNFPFFFVNKLGKWICAIFLVYFGITRPAEELAGGDTTVVVRFLAELAADKWVYWIAVAFFGGAWYHERRANRQYRKRHGQHEKKLMQMLDSKRGSSGLTDEGTRDQKES